MHLARVLVVPGEFVTEHLLLVVDPQRGLTIVLLTNRVYVSREPGPIAALRAAVHDGVITDLGLQADR